MKQIILLEGGESLGTRVSRGQALFPRAQDKDGGPGRRVDSSGGDSEYQDHPENFYFRNPAGISIRIVLKTEINIGRPNSEFCNL